LTYGELFLISTEKIMKVAGPYAAEGNQTKDNLIHLNDGEIVGEWRDSTYGKLASFAIEGLVWECGNVSYFFPPLLYSS
jgi:hypothetical protein